MTVGSVGGHYSRNLLVDLNEHVYVPRVREDPSAGANEPGISTVEGRRLRSTLVELDTELRSVQSVPLPYYEPDPRGDSLGIVGIVGFAYLRTGAIVFTTQSGAFWRLTPDARGPAKLEDLGSFHPESRAYASALFCLTGERHVCGLALLPNREYQWVIHDLDFGQSRVEAFDRASQQLLARDGLQLFGNNTRDDQDAAYLTGAFQRGDDFEPCAYRIRWPELDPGAAAAEPRYRLIEQYGIGAPSDPPGTIGAYRAAFRESVRITARAGDGAAPQTSDFSRQAIWRERAAQASRRAGRDGIPVVRHYEKVVQTPATPAGRQILEERDFWLSPQPIGAAQVISLAPKPALHYEEYRFLTQQPSIPELAGALPSWPVRVGDSWVISRLAAQSLLSSSVQAPSSLKATLESVAPGNDRKTVATISIQGTATTNLGETAVNARFEFAFEPPSGPRTRAVLEALGAIVSVSASQENQGLPAPTDPNQKQDLRRELVYRGRQLWF